MKRNDDLDRIVLRYHDLLTELQIVSYETANKLDNPRFFFYIKEAEERGLETSLEILANHIQTVNHELGNPNIEDINAFVREYSALLFTV